MKSTPLIDDQNDERIRKEIDFNPRSFDKGVECLIKEVRKLTEEIYEILTTVTGSFQGNMLKRIP